VNLTLINFGIQGKDENHSQGPTIKTEHVLQYITDGEGFLELSDNVYRLKKGDLFYLPKNKIVRYYAKKDNPYTYFWIGVDGANASKLIGWCGLSEKTPIKLIDGDLSPIFISIHNALSKSCLSGYVGANAKMIELVSILLSTEDENNKTLKNVSVNYVEKAITFIQDNFGKDINVTEIARVVGLKRNYFCGVFKKYTGSSPVDYLMNYRINQAKLMLSHGMNVTETAINCGFNSPSNFGAQFKRIVGMTPFAYRRFNISLK
jgi:AraC family transcriptional regulator of arabinose operon